MCLLARTTAAFVAGLTALLCWLGMKLYRRFTHAALDDVPGPPADSWFYGNLYKFLRSGDLGGFSAGSGVVKIKGAFGQNVLLVSDPKALQFISHTTGYRFHRDREHTAIVHSVVGPSLVWADGEDHKRHRKVMLPGFGAPETKAFLPLMSSAASQMLSKWTDLINASTEPDGSATVEILTWVMKATVDVIGKAAFDYDFGALEDTDNDLLNTLRDVPLSTFGSPTPQSLVFLTFAQLFPASLLRRCIENAPFPRLRHAQQAREKTIEMTRALIREKSKHVSTSGSKDIIGLAMRANISEDATLRLDEDELIAQVRLLTVAGNETTANSIAWALLELVRHPEMQVRLREEIYAKRRLKGPGTEWTVKDFDDMQFLGAVVKETLRFHPVAPLVFREASQDDVLPLSRPLKTRSGQVIMELPIPRGTKIIVCISGYNRDTALFGDDASTFNPDRWLHSKEAGKAVTLGPYENLMSFSAGVRACIAWRFAVLEMQAFLVDMLSAFEFSQAHVDLSKIREEFCDVMTLTVEGEIEQGSQLHLKIRPV